MRYLFPIWGFLLTGFFFPCSSYGQLEALTPTALLEKATQHERTGQLDSSIFLLQRVITQLPANATSELGHTHFRLADVYIKKGQPELAAPHLDSAYIHARTESNHALQLNILSDLALLHNQKGEFQEALTALHISYDLALAEQDSATLISTVNQLATIYFPLGKLDSAELYFEKLLALKEGENQRMEVISDLNQFGNMFVSKGEYDKAQTYFFDALAMAEKLNDTLLMVGVLSDIGQVFIRQQSWENANNFVEKALSISQQKGLDRWEAINLKHLGLIERENNHKTSSLSHFQESLEIQTQKLGNQIEIAQLQLLIAGLLEETADHPQALSYLNQALIYKKQQEDILGIMDIELEISSIYLKQERTQEALSMLKSIEKRERSVNSIRIRERVSFHLSKAYERKGNYPKALAYHQAYSSFKDSLFNDQNNTIINELASKYDAARREKENAELEANLIEQQLRIQDKERIISQKTQQNYLLIGSIVLAILGIILILYLNRKRQELDKQKLITLEKEKEASSLRARISGEERERKRIAQELHDGLGSLLAAIKMQFSAVQKTIPDLDSSARYVQASQLLDEACEEVREVSHNLMPGTLIQSGLKKSLEERIHILSQSHQLEITFISHGLDASLAEATTVSIYRIIQELLSNIIKHAKASEALVQVNREDHQLLITVEDNGEGFEQSDSHNKQGIGLRNIQSRLDYLGGAMSIDSQKKEGTSIHIEIPLNPM
ncbi:MAG: histidine kinase [Bacteroidota bacterium]